MTAQPLYTTQILRLAASLEPPEDLKSEHGRAELRSPTCGSRIVTSIALDDRGHVQALSQEVHACSFGQAAAALVQRGALGRSEAEVEAVLDAMIAWLGGEGELPQVWPGLEALAPARTRTGRHGAILLPFRALAAAMKAAS